MNVYIYNADIYCERCGKDIRRRIRQEGKAPANPKDEHTYDSDEYPKGPYPSEDDASDSPDHCGAGEECFQAVTLSDGSRVGCMLENPLTEEGIRYVKEHRKENPKSEVVKMWVKFYL